MSSTIWLYIGHCKCSFMQSLIYYLSLKSIEFVLIGSLFPGSSSWPCWGLVSIFVRTCLDSLYYVGRIVLVLRDSCSGTLTECLESLTRFSWLIELHRLHEFSIPGICFQLTVPSMCSLPDPVESCPGHLKFIICSKSQSNPCADVSYSCSRLLSSIPWPANPSHLGCHQVC